jgi:hypothetical protein
MIERRHTLRDLFAFVREQKLYLLAPILLLLALLAIFILLAEIPVLTPFIYALF